MRAMPAWTAYMLSSLLLAWMLEAGPLRAEDDHAANTFKVAGQELSCTDYRGRQVQTYTVAGLGDAGWSEIYFRVPVIKLDPEVLDTLPGKLQIFFFLHECGHHKLGHLVSGSAQAEPEADCWAAQTGRDNHLFEREDVVAFGRYFAASGGSRAGHLPGPQRHAYLLKCFDDTSGTPPVP